ncbi:MAG: ABC transporter permease [Defluviitaleaceae bacterium]|nr:ABC transporter permease [Defluviitaleaceae bacterium]MCL2275423.1 ABC transporter permease [Defluviitaleaceae bacterium]
MPDAGFFELVFAREWDDLARSLTGNINMTFENYLAHLQRTLPQATIDTIYMVSFASLFAVLFGIIVGMTLYVTQPSGIYALPKFNRLLGAIINIGRSIPFVVLIILVFPLSRVIVGTSIGRTASIVPLTIAAIPFMSRVIEAALNELGRGIIEAAVAAGASPSQIIFRVVLPESAPGLVSGFTLTIINLITFSAMAGVIGGGGLGHIAHSYGVARFRTDMLVYTIIILVVLVQIIQAVGQYISRRLDKR